MHHTATDLNPTFAPELTAGLTQGTSADAATAPVLPEPGTIRPGERHFDTAAGWQSPAPGALPPLLAAASRRYTATWAGLGAVSALYLGIVAWQQTQGVESALVPVTETLERLANDIADLKHATAAIDTRERATTSRVAAAEQRLDGLAQVASNAPPAGTGSSWPAQTSVQDQRATNRLNLAAAGPAPTPGLAAQQAAPALKAPDPAPAAKVAVAAKPKPAVAAALVPATIAPATNPVRTGSVTTAPATALPQGVLIASGPSLESVRLSWSVLNQKHGAVLGSLEPRVVPAGDGSAFNLIAGPFASDADAQAVCASLKAQGVGCKAAVFTGAAL